MGDDITFSETGGGPEMARDGQGGPGGVGGWRLGGLVHQDMDGFYGENDEAVDFLNMFSQHFQTPIYWTETI